MVSKRGTMVGFSETLMLCL